jgi:hypothetical protein
MTRPIRRDASTELIGIGDLVDIGGREFGIITNHGFGDNSTWFVEGLDGLFKGSIVLRHSLKPAYWTFLGPRSGH